MKTLHYSENPHVVRGYVMFNFFSFRDGDLHIGQSQAVPFVEAGMTREALKRMGWTPADYQYVNGKAVLVEGK